MIAAALPPLPLSGADLWRVFVLLWRGLWLLSRRHWGERASALPSWFYPAQAGAAFVFALPFWWLAAYPEPETDTRQWCGIELSTSPPPATGPGCSQP